MLAFDPTSAPQSLPNAPGDVWTVDDVAALQRSATALHRARGPAGNGELVAELEAAGAPVIAAADAVTQLVSGRYRGASGETELELRIDIDGERPTRRVSGDFFRRSGATKAYAGSFMVNDPAITTGSAEIVVEGEGVFSFASASPRLRLTIPRATTPGVRSPVEARFVTNSGGAGASYACTFETTAFRTLELEQDIVGDVVKFESYDVSSLPSTGRNRVLTVAAAYGEAGIEVLDTGGTNRVPADLAGDDRIWTNRELHFAMTRHFSRLTPQPAWRVYLLAATVHEIGSGLRGIMFDSDKRQGCAIFHDVVGAGDTSEASVRRAMLRTYVHEMGHCFNLYHSHMKDRMDPPRPNRLDALSWMHYPDSYIGPSGSGAGAYWRAFPFQFDDDELVHLRHGFRDAVVPGGNPFGQGAADIDPRGFADPLADESGLGLEIRGPGELLLGAPVILEFKLFLTDLRGRVANTRIHPNYGFTQLAISRAGGSTVVYRPLMTQCADPKLIELTKENDAIYDSAYVGFGKDGFHFAEPGAYEIRALYNAPDGSRIVSNVLRLRVKAPLDRQESELADLFIGDQQGTLFCLLGSEDENLAKGADALRLAADKFPTHPMASYANLIRGMGASYGFKRLEGGQLSVGKPKLEESEKALAAAVGGTINYDPTADMATPQADVVPKLDNISLNMAVQRLARVRHKRGQEGAAARTAGELMDYLEKEGVSAKVRSRVRGRLDQLLTNLGEDPTPARGRTRAAPKRTTPRKRK